jgi:hypothetical protein
MDIAHEGSAVLDTLSTTAVLQTDRGTFVVGQGMEVVGSDGVRVGVLREVRPGAGPALARALQVCCSRAG